MTAEKFLSGLTRVRAQCLTENAVRITHAPASVEAYGLQGADAFPPDRPWLSHVLLPTEGVTADKCRLVVDLHEGRVRVRDHAGNVILAEARAPRLGMAKRMRSVTVGISGTGVPPGF